MAKSVECTFKQVSHACRWSRHSSRLSRIKTNTVLYLGKYARLLPGLGRGATPPCRGVASMATFKGMKSGKIWVSLSWRTWWTWRTWTWGRWMQRSWFAITKSEISSYEFKNMDLGTHIQGSCENKHKNMNLNANFQIKQDFSFKNTWTLFSLSKTNFKSMHDMQNGADHAMQLDDQ